MWQWSVAPKKTLDELEEIKPENKKKCTELDNLLTLGNYGEAVSQAGSKALYTSLYRSLNMPSGAMLRF